MLRRQAVACCRGGGGRPVSGHPPLQAAWVDALPDSAVASLRYRAGNLSPSSVAAALIRVVPPAQQRQKGRTATATTTTASAAMAAATVFARAALTHCKSHTLPLADAVPLRDTLLQRGWSGSRSTTTTTPAARGPLSLLEAALSHRLWGAQTPPPQRSRNPRRRRREEKPVREGGPLSALLGPLLLPPGSGGTLWHHGGEAAVEARVDRLSLHQCALLAGCLRTLDARRSSLIAAMLVKRLGRIAGEHPDAAWPAAAAGGLTLPRLLRAAAAGGSRGPLRGSDEVVAWHLRENPGTALSLRDLCGICCGGGAGGRHVPALLQGLMGHVSRRASPGGGLSPDTPFGPDPVCPDAPPAHARPNHRGLLSDIASLVEVIWQALPAAASGLLQEGPECASAASTAVRRGVAALCHAAVSDIAGFAAEVPRGSDRLDLVVKLSASAAVLEALAAGWGGSEGGPTAQPVRTLHRLAHRLAEGHLEGDAPHHSGHTPLPDPAALLLSLGAAGGGTSQLRVLETCFASHYADAPPTPLLCLALRLVPPSPDSAPLRLHVARHLLAGRWGDGVGLAEGCALSPPELAPLLHSHHGTPAGGLGGGRAAAWWDGWAEAEAELEERALFAGYLSENLGDPRVVERLLYDVCAGEA